MQAYGLSIRHTVLAPGHRKYDSQRKQNDRVSRWPLVKMTDKTLCPELPPILVILRAVIFTILKNAVRDQ